MGKTEKEVTKDGIPFFELEQDQPHDGQHVWYIPMGRGQRVIATYWTAKGRDREIDKRGSFHVIDQPHSHSTNWCDQWAPIVFPGRVRGVSDNQLRHVGYDEHRLKVDWHNEIEIAFAAEWAKKHSSLGNPVLRLLVPDPTQRDAKVAATIIQWLGTTVGLCFLRSVVRESPELGDHLSSVIGWREDINERQRKEEQRDSLIIILRFIEEKLPDLQNAKRGSDEYLVLQMIDQFRRECGMISLIQARD